MQKIIRCALLLQKPLNEFFSKNLVHYFLSSKTNWIHIKNQKISDSGSGKFWKKFCKFHKVPENSGKTDKEAIGQKDRWYFIELSLRGSKNEQCRTYVAPFSLGSNTWYFTQNYFQCH